MHLVLISTRLFGVNFKNLNYCNTGSTYHSEFKYSPRYELKKDNYCQLVERRIILSKCTEFLARNHIQVWTLYYIYIFKQQVLLIYLVFGTWLLQIPNICLSWNLIHFFLLEKCLPSKCLPFSLLVNIWILKSICKGVHANY